MDKHVCLFFFKIFTLLFLDFFTTFVWHVKHMEIFWRNNSRPRSRQDFCFLTKDEEIQNRLLRTKRMLLPNRELLCGYGSSVLQGCWNLLKSGGAKDMNFKEKPLFL